MPTNFIRRDFERPGRAIPTGRGPGLRVAKLTAGRVALRLALFETRTADVIWQGLPLYSIVETWGESIHFETPLRTDRERTAKLNVAPGDVCFWTEDERVVLAWGPTPISRPGEVRLMRPCNVWASALDPPSALSVVTPGEKVTLVRTDERVVADETATDRA